MNPIVRNVLAFLAATFVGGCVNMLIVSLGHLAIPLPADVDMSDVDNLAENMAKLEPQHLIPPWLAHAVGTLVGGWLVAKLAASHRLILGLGIGIFFLLGGITMVAMVGGPIWFVIADLVGAYLPMAYLGVKLSGVPQS